jgi:hypothetical protein
MQGIFYVALCVFLMIFDFTFQQRASLDQIFSWKEMEFTVRGGVVIASFLLTALFWLESINALLYTQTFPFWIL